jgi:N6-L-threonylcarbamoyladenine synthase
LSNRARIATVFGMPILTIETTCDETAAAVIADDGAILGDCVATQEALHERFRGVVPEVAARAHSKSLSVLVLFLLQ